MGDINKVGDVKKLFKKSDSYEVTLCSESEWTVTFTGGRYDDYTLKLKGNGLLGGTDSLAHSGMIHSIKVTPPLEHEESGWTGSDLELSGYRFLKKVRLDKLEDEDDDGDDDDDYYKGDDDNNDLKGDDDHDYLEGLGGNDRMRGRDGDDDMEGGYGHDRLTGDKGRDTLNGGADNDRLKGGKDNDLFVFTKDGGHDRVDDFEGVVRNDDDDTGYDDDDSEKPGEGDILDFSDFGLTAADGAFDTMEEIIAATGATQVGEHVVFSLEGGETTIMLKEVNLSDLRVDDFAF